MIFLVKTSDVSGSILILQGVICEHWKLKSERTNELAGMKRSDLSDMAHATSYHLSNFHKNTNDIQMTFSDQCCLFSFGAFLLTPSLSQALDLTFGTCHERWQSLKLPTFNVFMEINVILLCVFRHPMKSMHVYTLSWYMIILQLTTYNRMVTLYNDITSVFQQRIMK